VIKRKLIQIIFFYKEVIRLAQRFIAEKLLIVNSTFNTNKLRLPFLIGVGITNNGKTFPYALSYCPGETAKSYNFFFQTLRQEIWIDCYKPIIILRDQSARLISAINSLRNVPYSQLQFCN
jgi:MULE transposase domain